MRPQALCHGLKGCPTSGRVWLLRSAAGAGFTLGLKVSIFALPASWKRKGAADDDALHVSVVPTKTPPQAQAVAAFLISVISRFMGPDSP